MRLARSKGNTIGVPRAREARAVEVRTPQLWGRPGRRQGAQRDYGSRVAV